MDNIESFQQVATANFSTKFRRPLFESYCFSRILPTIKSLFSGQARPEALPAAACAGLAAQYDRIALIFVDSFGWEFFNHFTEIEPHPVIRDLREQATCSKITTLFPSTTAVHVSSINLGELHTQHGICEWFYFEDRIGKVICPFRYTYAGSSEVDLLEREGYAASDVFRESQWYAWLKSQGIAARIPIISDFLQSGQTRAMLNLAELQPFENEDQSFSILREILLSGDDKLFTYYYWPAIDTACHKYGPFSDEMKSAVHSFFERFNEEVLTLVRKNGPKTLFLFVADHGHVPVDPSTTFYLDQKFPELTELMKKDRSGDPIVPCGSRRDFFLHIQETSLNDTSVFLKEALSGLAEVVFVQDLIEQGIFGPGPYSKEFLINIGNLVILPYKGSSVYWAGEGNRFCKDFLGGHGGLTPEEMETIFLALEV